MAFSSLLLLSAYTTLSIAAPTPQTFTYSPPIKKGYVAFGDSYAAGMGTGTTTTDSCRVGSNNFAELIKRHNDADERSDLQYQFKMCSGDTTIGINRQIDEWTNPQDYDVATMSVGGNDLQFGDLLKSCVLELNVLDFFGGWAKADCDKLKAQARFSMTDRGTEGLLEKLRKAYSYVLDKSGSDLLHLYVTSYPRFFNDVDEDCDKTTFYWYQPSYNPSWDGRKIKLSRELRRELNGLVDQLNALILDAVNEANAIIGGPPRVHLVDMNRKWDEAPGHHFCEAGNFHEPDENRPETWFFLSAWKDIGDTSPAAIAGAISGLLPGGLLPTAEESEIQAVIKAGPVTLPNNATCQAELGTDPDPWARWLCHTARVIAAEPDGETAKVFSAANDEVRAGDVNGQHIPWLAPTRQIKTFHPRSVAMAVYKDEILSAVRQYQ